MTGDRGSFSSDDSDLVRGITNRFAWENRWVARQPWPLQRGYELRPRFRQGWKPSWRWTAWLPLWAQVGYLDPFWHEDSVTLEQSEVIMDAVRVKDGAFVAMKIIDKDRHPYELELSRYLSSPELAHDPRNHCVPILDAFDAPDDPDRLIIVMPLLKRLDQPPFETVSELVNCLSQVFAGLQFIHEHHIAHRDCFWPNIMMDASPMYPIPYHPCKPKYRHDWKRRAWHFSRTQRPVKYYFIDFGLSRYYVPANGPLLEYPIMPADKSVPEFQGAKGYEASNPFASDIYMLGNAIRARFTACCDSGNLHFLDSLISGMTREDPAMRPGIQEVVERFAVLRAGLDEGALCSQLTVEGETYWAKNWKRLRLKGYH